MLVHLQSFACFKNQSPSRVPQVSLEVSGRPNPFYSHLGERDFLPELLVPQDTALLPSLELYTKGLTIQRQVKRCPLT